MDRIAYEMRLCRYWEARFMSHLDINRAMIRALRRSGLKVYYSEGFNPKVKMTYLTSPLSTGQTSECEIVRFMLVDEAIPPDVVLERIERSGLPIGLRIADVRVIGDESKWDSNAYRYVYRALFRVNSFGMSERGVSEECMILDNETLRDEIEKCVHESDGNGYGVHLINDEDGCDVLATGDSKAFIRDYFRVGVEYSVPAGDGYVKPSVVVPIPGAGVACLYHRHRLIKGTDNRI